MPSRRRPRALRALSVPTVNRVRRELRDDLARRGYEPGPLEHEAAQAVLHEAVEFYVARLQEKVSRLLRFDAIGELMARYELFLAETEHDQGALQAREQNVIAVASRFCVEMAAAQPPVGVEPATDERYEELVAAAAEIVNHGIHSDLLHTGAVPVSVWIDDAGYLSNLPEQEGDLRLLAFAQQWSEGGRAHMLARWQHREVDADAMIAEFGATYEDLFRTYDSVRRGARRVAQDDAARDAPTRDRPAAERGGSGRAP